MNMPGRTYSSQSTYRYGFNGQEKSDEIAAGLTTALYWEYDSRIGRRWNVDPKGYLWQSPYVVIGNSPLIMIDPKGDKEYKSLSSYKKKTGKEQLGQGDWLKSDRTKNTKVWKDANTYNLQLESGSDEYTSITQRADFYNWFQEAVNEKGFEIKWAGAASKIAKNVDMLTENYAKFLGYSNDELAQFAKDGNAMIFIDVFPKLKKLFNGKPLKGKDAEKWDALALSQEQSLIQPLYEFNKSIGLLSALTKQRVWFSSWAASVPPFPKDKLLTSLSDRWVYGMSNMGYLVGIHNMPDPGKEYKSDYSIDGEEYIYGAQYMKIGFGIYVK